jgi:multidrug efflux pump subunit AcrA (membrane-fusion protein)
MFRTRLEPFSTMTVVFLLVAGLAGFGGWLSQRMMVAASPAEAARSEKPGAAGQPEKAAPPRGARPPGTIAWDKREDSVIHWVIDDGEQVQQGQIIVEMDAGFLRKRLEAVQSAREKALTESSAAEKNMKRVEAEARLEKNKAQADSKVSEAAAEVKARAAVLEQLARKKREIEAELESFTIRAPRDGKVEYHVPRPDQKGHVPIVAVGEPVKAGQVLMHIVPAAVAPEKKQPNRNVVLHQQLEKLTWRVMAVEEASRTLRLQQTSRPAGIALQAVVAKDASVLLDGREGKLADLRVGMTVAFRMAGDRPIITRCEGYRDRGPAVLQAVDVEKMTITVLAGGQQWTAPVGAGATIRIERQVSRFSDLKPGMFVYVELAVDKDQFVVKEIQVNGGERKE